MLNATMYAGLLPATSPNSPKMVGDSPWRIMYEVMVKLMRLILTPRSFARGFNTGK
jgi:hypothetical protein